LLPGMCRGFTAANGAHVEIDGYYKNKWWIVLENARNAMARERAKGIVQDLHQRMHPEYERILGCSLVELFDSLK